MRRNRFLPHFSIGLLFLALCHFVSTCWAQEGGSEFKRVRRIYIEGARFMQEKRYDDALPMLQQAYQMLSRSIKKGSKSKRVIRAHKKLRYFIGFSHYQVGQKYLAVMTVWLKKNPRPKKIEKVKKIVIIKKIKEKPKPAGVHPVPLIIIGVGVATALGGVVTALLANNDVSERDKVYKTLIDSETKEPSSERIAELHHEAESLATVSYALWAAGGGIAAIGLVLVFIIKPTAPKTPPPKRSNKMGKKTNRLDGSFQLLGGTF